MKIAYVEYAFLFDPTKTWARLYEFEKAFAKMLAEYGMEAVLLDDVAGSGKKLYYIQPIEKIGEEKPGKPGRPLSLKAQIEKLKPKSREKASARDFKKGKLLKSKGYLKRG